LLLCMTCGQPREKGRRNCPECHKKEARLRSKKRYEKGIRTIYQKICEACNNPYTTTHKSSILCLSCYRIGQKTNGSTKYKYSDTGKLHREIAEELLKRKLDERDHVHHIDEDRSNNNPRNLIVISNRNHPRLHRYLTIQKSILIKKLNIDDSQWKKIIRDLSLSWIEANSIKVTKLWEIGGYGEIGRPARLRAL